MKLKYNMESVREVTRRYNSIVEKLKDEASGKMNCYKCKCGHITKTIDLDAGTTPFVMRCEECKSFAHSTFYNDIALDKIPSIEWFRPSLKETLKLRKKPQSLEHVLMGGLQPRKIT